MNGKQVKRIRAMFKTPKLSVEPTYNIEGGQPYPDIETVYLTVECQRFFTQKAKKEYKRIKRGW